MLQINYYYKTKDGDVRRGETKVFYNVNEAVRCAIALDKKGCLIASTTYCGEDFNDAFWYRYRKVCPMKYVSMED